MTTLLQSFIGGRWIGAQPAQALRSAINGQTVAHTHAEALDFAEAVDYAHRVGLPGLLALERLRYAARLARSSGLPMVTSGGLHFGAPPTEAALMAEVLQRDHGVGVRWQEGQSRTTEENARQVASLLQAEGIRRVIVVTQAWHMPRSRWSFENAGLQVLAAPVGYLGVPNGRPLGGWLPEAKAFWQNSLLLNEAVGQLGYRLFYRSP
mgnify:CR=1 FL=1